MEKHYLIKDSNGKYDCDIFLIAKEDETGTEWGYCYRSNAIWSHTNKDVAELALSKLKEINALAGFNVDFSVEEFECEDYWDFFNKAPIIPFNSPNSDFFVEYKDIPKGTICKTRKALHDIWKKYKAMKKALEINITV